MITGYPAGICPRHQRPNIVVNDVPMCLSCNAAPREGEELVVTAEDPGHAAMGEVLSKVPAVAVAPATKKVSAVPAMSFEEGLSSILQIMQALPMPKDLKQFKLVSKMRDQITKMLQEKTDVGN